MSTSLSPLLAPMLSSAAMRAVCDDATYLQHMLGFEAALARAEAATGVIPASAADPIAKACKAGSFDLGALAETATRSGNLAIPLVKTLTANVAKADPDAARYVHWGATSQDVIDTAAVLSLRAGIDALLSDVDRAIAGFAKLATKHRDTAMVARTWLQHALPMPFGLKLAEYAAALHRSRARLQRLRREGLALQFGGAAGTLAALGDKGLLVAERLAQELELTLPAAPWHTEWPTLPMLLLVTSGALAATVDIAEGLEVDTARMRVNLEATHGLIMAEAVTMALAETIGKSEAHHLIGTASKKAVADKKNLRDVLASDAEVTAHLSADKLTKLFEPMAYQGVSQALIDRLLASLDKK